MNRTFRRNRTQAIPTVYCIEPGDFLGPSTDLLNVVSAKFPNLMISSPELLSIPADELAGCILCPIQPNDSNIFTLQLHLNRVGSTLPVVVWSPRADARTVVRLFQSGVSDFLEVPTDPSEISVAIEAAFAENVQRARERKELRKLFDRFSSLSRDEIQSLTLLAQGYSNKQVAAQLNTSLRTIESRKLRLLSKTRSAHLPDLLISFHRYKYVRAKQPEIANHG